VRYVKDTLYKRLIQSKRWQQVRNRYLKEHPACERCGKPGEEVHHIKNLMQFREDPIKMEQMAFDDENLMTCCHECHQKLHYEMGKNRNKAEHAAAYHKEKLDNFYKEYFE